MSKNADSFDFISQRFIILCNIPKGGSTIVAGDFNFVFNIGQDKNSGQSIGTNFKARDQCIS